MARRRRRRKAKKTDQKRGLGELLFFGLALLIAAIPYFLKDYLGLQYRWVGTYIWLAAFIFAFAGYLFYLLLFVLPLPWSISLYEGLRLSLPFNFPILDTFFHLGTSRPAITPENADKLRPGFIRHRAGIIDSNQSLVVSSGSKFSRAVGPGYIRLRTSEMVTQVVDLRRHISQIDVKAMTSDGLPVETSITVHFQVRQQDPPEEVDLIYPYDSGAVFWVNYLESFKSSTGILAWGERIAKEAAGEFVDELSRYTIDQLLQSDTTDTSAINQAKSRMQKRLTAKLDQYGVSVLHVSIGSFRLPDEVIKGRIENWQEELQIRIDRTLMLDGTAQEKRKLAAEASARVELIDYLTKEIEKTWADGDVDLAGAVIIKVIDELAIAASDSQVRALLPDTTLSTVEQVENWLNRRSKD